MQYVRDGAARCYQVSGHAPTEGMKIRIRRKVAGCQGFSEERDELGLVEAPDGLSRLAEVNLRLEGVIEAEEVPVLDARALASDGVAVWMALAIAKVNTDLVGGRLEDNMKLCQAMEAGSRRSLPDGCNGRSSSATRKRPPLARMKKRAKSLLPLSMA